MVIARTALASSEALAWLINLAILSSAVLLRDRFSAATHTNRREGPLARMTGDQR